MSIPTLLDDFANPGAVYRGIPFWALNGDLRRDELVRQIDFFEQMGLGGACLHSRSGLVTKYLSAEWFKLMGDCVEHAKHLGMIIWLYDEDRFPSGAAGGIVTRDPAHRQKRLWMRVVQRAAGSGQQAARSERQPIAWFALRGSLKSPRGVRRIASPDECSSSEMLLGFHVQPSPLNSWYNGYTYLDTMSPAAVDAFIQSTYEPYQRTMGAHFGRTIEGIFTDEPNRGPFLSQFWGEFIDGYQDVELHEIPWTPALPELFNKRCGYDLLDHLPELYLDVPGRATARTRYDYFDLTSDLLAKSFGARVGGWCERNGVQLVGHVQGEESPSIQTNLIGSAMRFYPHMQMPGIDVLTEKCRDYDAPIQCASVAHQMGRRWVMSETHGATGWDLPMETHKAIADWQMALGINRRCLHLAFYTMAGSAKRDYPASISFQSAWAKHYAKLEDYHARMATVLSRGESASQVLVINPLESTWLRVGLGWQQRSEVSRLDKNVVRLRDWLLEAHIGFDYGDEEMMGRIGRVQRRRAAPNIVVGKAEYGIVVVPPWLTIRSSTLKLLSAFRDAGGKIVWIGPPPELVDALPSDEARRDARRGSRAQFTRASVASATRGLNAVKIAPAKAGKNVLVHLRRDGGLQYLMLCNTDRVHGTGALEVSIAGDGAIQEWDSTSGRRFIVPARRRRGRLQFKADMPRCGTRLFVIGVDLPDDAEVKPVWREVRHESLPKTGWRFELSEPNPLVLDYVSVRMPDQQWIQPREVLKADAWIRRELGWRPRRYHDAQPWAMADGVAAAAVQVRAAFGLDASSAPGDAELALEHMPGLRRAQINDHEVDLSRDGGWWMDPCLHRHPIPGEWLRPGENEVVLWIDYGTQSGLEAMYILSACGVRAGNKRATLVDALRSLRVGDLTRQGLPFYGAAVAYVRKIKAAIRPGESAFLKLNEWAGCCVVVKLDGRQIGELLWPPYELPLPVQPGVEHELSIEVVLGRGNTLGPLHYRGDWPDWISPQLFDSEGPNWQDRYRLRRTGLLSPPSLCYRRST